MNIHKLWASNRYTRLSVLLMLVLTLVLSACGGDATPTTQPVAPTNTAAEAGATPQASAGTPTEASAQQPTAAATSTTEASSATTPSTGGQGGGGGTLRWSNEGVSELDTLDP